MDVVGVLLPSVVVGVLPAVVLLNTVLPTVVLLGTTEVGSLVSCDGSDGVLLESVSPGPSHCVVGVVKPAVVDTDVEGVSSLPLLALTALSAKDRSVTKQY